MSVSKKKTKKVHFFCTFFQNTDYFRLVSSYFFFLYAKIKMLFAIHLVCFSGFFAEYFHQFLWFSYANIRAMRTQFLNEI